MNVQSQGLNPPAISQAAAESFGPGAWLGWKNGGAIVKDRQWTIYLTQDKHLDYNWCGTPAEIEVRMAALLDYYLDLVERSGGCWNLDGTLWLEVYRRQRGEAGAERLLQAIREGHIGYAANHSVLLWGLLSTELSIRACYGALPIEKSAGHPARTVLLMENYGLPWGAATALSDAGFAYIGRGIYPLRAESYAAARKPYPLSWWEAPGGERLLVRWDCYEDTRRWGGYAEAFELARIAGEGWDAYHLQDWGDRNTEDVYRQRVAYVRDTVARYAAYGDRYPISSILLLGTGWDNWTRTPDIALFIQRFNAESDSPIRLVDARYEDFFAAAQAEVDARGLTLPVLRGTFGICWEEWAAHLAGPTLEFREAERLLRQAEALYALDVAAGQVDEKRDHAIRQGFQALLRFAEHDFGGTDRSTAAISAGVRAGAATEALSIGRSLSDVPDGVPWPRLMSPSPSELAFGWRGGQVHFDSELCGVASLIDSGGREWVPQDMGLVLGEFAHARYHPDDRAGAVFPTAISTLPDTQVDRIVCRQGGNGIAIETEGRRWGFEWATQWFFHHDRPWIDVRYELEGGWTEDPQAIRFCFPLSIARPVYRYDMGAAILTAGPVDHGGDDLPGANQVLYAAQTFAAACGEAGGAVLLVPDAPLIQFGSGVRGAYQDAPVPAQLVAVPMMNMTRNDWQFMQGGWRRWRFRYRLVLFEGGFDPLTAMRAGQHLGVPPFLKVPGEIPAVTGLSSLDIDFEGGPVTAFKVAEDGTRLILRLWNVLDRVVPGSVATLPGWPRVTLCDALERPLRVLPVEDARAEFAVGARTTLTLALCHADGSRAAWTGSA